MKRLFFTLFILSFCIPLMGCNSIEEQRAENAIEKYYQALVKEDYVTAFKGLFLYEGDYPDEQTSLSNAEAQTLYLEKINYLKDQNYKFSGFEIIEVEYEDGHSFWHHLNIEVVQGGETFYYKERAFFHVGKLKVSGEDPYIQYRDGKMNVKLNR
jgi:hypothetical protein